MPHLALYRLALLPAVTLAACVSSEPAFENVEGLSQPSQDASLPQSKDAAADRAEAEAADEPEAAAPEAAPDQAADVPEEAPPSCDPLNSCPDFEQLGNMSADIQAQTRTLQDSRSRWYGIRFLEDDSGLSAVDLKATLTLTSPPGANFDLFVYMAATAQQTDVECTQITASSTSATGPDVVHLSWPDKQGLGGLEDSRNVTIEVRFVDGQCPQADLWTFLIEGNK